MRCILILLLVTEMELVLVAIFICEIARPFQKQDAEKQNRRVLRRQKKGNYVK